MPASCSPPKSQAVKAHTRAKPRRKVKRAASAAAFVVRNERTGRVVSRHRSMTAAVNARKRLDLVSFRQGNGRPYNVEKA